MRRYLLGLLAVLVCCCGFSPTAQFDCFPWIGDDDDSTDDDDDIADDDTDDDATTGGLMVTLASNTPGGLLLPGYNSTMVIWQFTAASDGEDVLVDGLTLCLARSEPTPLAQVRLTNESGFILGTPIDPATDQVEFTFTDLGLVVPAGQSRSILVKVDILKQLPPNWVGHMGILSADYIIADTPITNPEMFPIWGMIRYGS